MAVPFVAAAAVIGKANNPLLFVAYDKSRPALDFQYVVHTSLDAVEEREATAPNRFLGLLMTTGEHAVYGSVSNTRVKFILVLSTTSTPNQEQLGYVADCLRLIQEAYCVAICNPFYRLGTPLDSPRLLSSTQKLCQLLPPF